MGGNGIKEKTFDFQYRSENQQENREAIETIQKALPGIDIIDEVRYRFYSKHRNLTEPKVEELKVREKLIPKSIRFTEKSMLRKNY